MKYGLGEIVIEKICVVFARFDAVEKVVLYGSRAQDTYRDGSDIDLTLFGAGLTSHILGDIADALDDLLLPYMFDLSIYDELEHAKLIDHIKRVGITFYERKALDKENAANSRDVVSWSTNFLGKLCTIELGATPARRNPKYYDEDKKTGNVWLSIRDMPKTIGEELSDSKEYLSDDGADKVKLVKKGTLLFSFKLSIGRICFAGKDLRTNEAIAALSVKNEKELNKEYLAWYLSSQDWDEITAKDEKLLGKTLNKSKLKVLSISFPSLPEQKRIVKILDEAFAGIDQAIENTEKNLINARELFESYLNNIFTQKGEGWVEKTLADVAEFKNGLNFTKSSKGESIAILGVGDFKQRLWAPLSNLGDIQIDGNLPKTYELQKNDIVVVRSNGNKELIGRSLLVDEVKQKTSYSGFTIRVRLNTDEIAPFYLIHYLKSDYIHNLMTSAGGGANISNLNQKILSYLPIRYPDIGGQLEITKKIADLKEKQSQYIEQTTNKLISLKELKQSLLQKAFSGELTSDMREVA